MVASAVVVNEWLSSLRLLHGAALDSALCHQVYQGSGHGNSFDVAVLSLHMHDHVVVLVITQPCSDATTPFMHDSKALIRHCKQAGLAHSSTWQVCPYKLQSVINPILD